MYGRMLNGLCCAWCMVSLERRPFFFFALCGSGLSVHPGSDDGSGVSSIGWTAAGSTLRLFGDLRGTGGRIA